MEQNKKKLKKEWITKTLLFSNLIFIGLILTKAFVFSIDEEKEDLTFHEKFKQDYKIYSLNLPQKIEFAGELVPTQLIDVKEKLDRELLVNTYWQSNTMLYIKRSHKWFPIIEPILEEEGVPNDFKYLALIESGLTNVVSPSGAAGFWQIMKATGKENGLEINSEIDERYNLELATRVACKYLNEAKEKFGSWTLAAASYNMGMNGLSNKLEAQMVDNYYDLLLNEETSRYVFRILAAKQILSNPSNFGFNFREKDLYYQVATEKLTIDTTITDLAKFGRSNGLNYKVIKQFNPWLRSSNLPNASRKVYQLQIPKSEFRTLLVKNTSDTLK